MVISRGSLLARVVCNGLKANLAKVPANSQQIVRQSHAWSYRTAAPPHSKATMVTANIVGGFMWWWVLWHLFHEYEHITGEFEYPDASKWTNAELGIPPDSEE